MNAKYIIQLDRENIWFPGLLHPQNQCTQYIEACSVLYAVMCELMTDGCLWLLEIENKWFLLVSIGYPQHTHTHHFKYKRSGRGAFSIWKDIGDESKINSMEKERQAESQRQDGRIGCNLFGWSECNLLCRELKVGLTKLQEENGMGGPYLLP